MVDTLDPCYATLPRSIMIELTNHCQLSCVTCPRDKKDAHDYELGMISMDNFKTIFHQFEVTLEVLDLTGLGESLMHPQVFEMIRWVRSRRDLHIYLTTNTILLNNRIINQLKDDAVDTLCISVDGTTDSQLKAVRGIELKQLRGRVRATVEALKDVTEFIFCTVLIRENVGDMPKFVEIAAELGIRKVSLKPINLVATDISADYYRIFQTQQFVDLAEKSREIGQKLGVTVQIFQIGSYQCTFPWTPLYITWDGYLVPCCAKPFPKRMNFGNLLQQDIAEILNGKEIVEFRRKLLDSNASVEFCRKCHIMKTSLDISPCSPELSFLS